ncbi:MAG: sulfur oxidation c-type cytochrome SoxX [Henriciella sp.]|nr:sulfur oxidation c-type cytochrome SoxX [Henriciella sp.]
MRLRRAGLALALASCGDAEPRLVSETQIVGDAIPSPLSEASAIAARGKTVFMDREGGHCVLCHAIEGLEAEFQGNVGPDLSAVGERLSPGQLRLRIVDYQIVRPGTLMPSYYRIHDLYQVGEEYQDQPILTAIEVEDLVAYLSERR